jgi:hypothetical protein
MKKNILIFTCLCLSMVTYGQNSNPLCHKEQEIFKQFEFKQSCLDSNFQIKERENAILTNIEGILQFEIHPLKIFNSDLLMVSSQKEGRKSYSQTKSIGLSSGYSFARFLTGKELTSQGINRPIVNVFYENEFQKHLALKFGLSYYVAGDTENTSDINNKPLSLSWSYSYISAPITLKYSFGKKIKPYVKLGGYLSYLLNSNGLPFNQIKDANTIKYISLENETKSFDYGILFGAGIEFKINNQFHIFTETNAIYGLPKFDKYGSVIQHYVSIEVGVKRYLSF